MTVRRNVKIALLIIFIGLIVSFSTGFKYLQEKSVYEQYEPWETESILSTIEENTPYDMLLMGSSHGRLFSRNRNHILMEEAFQGNIATIAGGSSCVIPAEVFLDVFYAKKNTADTVLYVIDPWCFYSDKYNTGYIFEYEPFDLTLFVSMITHQIDPKIIKNYLSRTLRQGQKPYVNKGVRPRTEKLQSVDEYAVNDRLLDLYEGDIARNSNAEYIDTFTRINRAAKKQNSEIINIIPPTLYTDPHYDKLKVILDENKLLYVDMSESITDPIYYYDHDHLNVEGVKMFLNKLKEEIASRQIEY